MAATATAAPATIVSFLVRTISCSNFWHTHTHTESSYSTASTLIFNSILIVLSTVCICARALLLWVWHNLLGPTLWNITHRHSSTARQVEWNEGKGKNDLKFAIKILLHTLRFLPLHLVFWCIKEAAKWHAPPQQYMYQENALVSFLSCANALTWSFNAITKKYENLHRYEREKRF